MGEFIQVLAFAFPCRGVEDSSSRGCVSFSVDIGDQSSWVQWCSP